MQVAKYYYHLTNYHHRNRHVKRLKRMLVFGVVVVFVAAGVIAFDILRQRNEKPGPTSQLSTVVQQSPVAILRTEFFQFQAPIDWVEVRNESTTQKYVYREIKNTLINNQLEIYVNNAPKELLAEYVFPVTINKDQLGITATELSNHCKNSQATKPASNNPLTVTYKGVTFGCRIDGTEFIIVAGKVGGTPELKLMRPNGSAASYTLVYRDLTANPTGDDFSAILSSFQTR